MRRTRGELRIRDVQFDIHRELADMASGAQVVGAGEAYGTDNSKHIRTNVFVMVEWADTATDADPRPGLRTTAVAKAGGAKACVERSPQGFLPLRE